MQIPNGEEHFTPTPANRTQVPSGEQVWVTVRLGEGGTHRGNEAYTEDEHQSSDWGQPASRSPAASMVHL